jgi:CCR4-NOT transcription complex subunit 6
MANAEGSDNMLNRVMPKDNIGLAALLKTKEAAWDNGKCAVNDTGVSAHLSDKFMHILYEHSVCHDLPQQLLASSVFDLAEHS